MEGSDQRMRGANGGRGKRSEVEESSQRGKKAIRGRGERSEMEGNGQRWREMISLTEPSGEEGSYQRRRLAAKGRGAHWHSKVDSEGSSDTAVRGGGE